MMVDLERKLAMGFIYIVKDVEGDGSSYNEIWEIINEK